MTIRKFLHIKKLSLLAAILLSYSVIECGQVVERSEQPSRWDRFSSAISTSAKHAPWVAATGVGLYGLHNILSQGISCENMYAPLLTTGLAVAPFLANYKQPLQQKNEENRTAGLSKLKKDEENRTARLSKLKKDEENRIYEEYQKNLWSLSLEILDLSLIPESKHDLSQSYAHIVNLYNQLASFREKDKHDSISLPWQYIFATAAARRIIYKIYPKRTVNFNTLTREFSDIIKIYRYPLNQIKDTLNRASLGESIEGKEIFIVNDQIINHINRLIAYMYRDSTLHSDKDKIVKAVDESLKNLYDSIVVHKQLDIENPDIKKIENMFSIFQSRIKMLLESNEYNTFLQEESLRWPVHIDKLYLYAILLHNYEPLTKNYDDITTETKNKAIEKLRPLFYIPSIEPLLTMETYPSYKKLFNEFLRSLSDIFKELGSGNRVVGLHTRSLKGTGAYRRR